jgi:hypothetical protein
VQLLPKGRSIESHGCDIFIKNLKGFNDKNVDSKVNYLKAYLSHSNLALQLEAEFGISFHNRGLNRKISIKREFFKAAYLENLASVMLRSRSKFQILESQLTSLTSSPSYERCIGVASDANSFFAVSATIFLSHFKVGSDGHVHSKDCMFLESASVNTSDCINSVGRSVPCANTFKRGIATVIRGLTSLSISSMAKQSIEKIISDVVIAVSAGTKDCPFDIATSEQLKILCAHLLLDPSNSLDYDVIDKHDTSYRFTVCPGIQCTHDTQEFGKVDLSDYVDQSVATVSHASGQKFIRNQKCNVYRIKKWNKLSGDGDSLGTPSLLCSECYQYNKNLLRSVARQDDPHIKTPHSKLINKNKTLRLRDMSEEIRKLRSDLERSVQATEKLMQKLTMVSSDDRNEDDVFSHDDSSHEVFGAAAKELERSDVKSGEKVLNDAIDRFYAAYGISQSSDTYNDDEFKYQKANLSNFFLEQFKIHAIKNGEGIKYM